jgi:hypothetical protein
VALCANMAPFADNWFDCCDLLRRSVIYHGSGKALTKGDATYGHKEINVGFDYECDD